MLLNVIHNENCVQGMQKNIDEKSTDLIITDPPFAIEFSGKKANYNRDFDKVIDSYQEINKEDYSVFTMNWITEAKRILKDSGSMYVFSGWNNLHIVESCLESLGFKLVNHIIWKYQFGVNCTKKFISSHYHILYVCLDEKKRKFFPYCRHDKGDKTIKGRNARYADMEDVWLISRENWTGMQKTATKLPGELVKKIIQYSSEKGDLIVDPFSGSGQVAWFSKKMERDYICFEIDKDTFDFSQRRITENKYLLEKIV